VSPTSRRRSRRKRDRIISRLLDGLGDEVAIGSAATEIPPGQETVLGPYTQRMASLAVRGRSPTFLRSGLRAVALASAHQEDRRDLIVVLALLWRSAEHLRLDPAAQFTAAAQSFGRFGVEIADFAGRKPPDRTLEAMLYAEVCEGHEFRYEHRWGTRRR
jgi:hypothetical protein